MVAGVSDVGLDPAFKAKIDAMIAASGGRLYLKSGYRSIAEQSQLYDAAVQKYGAANAGNYVAPPGHSNHNRGLAADIGGDMSYLAQVAPQYGLERPMSWEPWHVEPVGLREHPQTSPSAYPMSQPGTINPTQDPNINTRPETIFARLSAALSGEGMHQTAEGVLPSQQSGAEMTPAAATMSNTAAAGGATGANQTSAQRALTLGKGAVDPHALYQQLRAQGLDPRHAAALVAIAGRESGYNPGAHNANAATGDNSYGLFQINLLNGMHSNFSPQMLTTPEGSVQAAASLVKADGLQPWGGYKGVAWSQGTNLQAAVDASGGEVTLQDLQNLQ